MKDTMVVLENPMTGSWRQFCKEEGQGERGGAGKRQMSGRQLEQEACNTASTADTLSRQRGQHDHRDHGASLGGWQCGCRSPAKAGPILGLPSSSSLQSKSRCCSCCFLCQCQIGVHTDFLGSALAKGEGIYLYTISGACRTSCRASSDERMENRWSMSMRVCPTGKKNKTY